MLGLDEQGWRANAKCKGADPNFFFPDAAAGVPEVLAFCAGCPVRKPCADWAIANEDHGIWGGLSERERRRLRRRDNVQRTHRKTRTRGRPAA